ncbi:uncharacterized protein [Procambarus clarkii]|uniref:uncharacterized protein n=1 Tax=Procambarus clarkii TaxID=6728 RepID=UPI0037423E97
MVFIVTLRTTNTRGWAGFSSILIPIINFPAVRMLRGGVALTVGVALWACLAPHPAHASDEPCGYKTVWLDKTMYRPVPYYHGGKSVENTYEAVYLTTTVLNKQSVPYFITQTQNVPQFVTKKATLPQYITHTVINTHPTYVTVTEKSYVTVYATRTRKTYETVCPKGYGHGGHDGGYGHR